MVQMGENEAKCSKEWLTCWLVERWADAEGFDPKFRGCKELRIFRWNLKSSLRVWKLMGGLLQFAFEDEEKFQRVWKRAT